MTNRLTTQRKSAYYFPRLPCAPARTVKLIQLCHVDGEQVGAIAPMNSGVCRTREGTRDRAAIRIAAVNRYTESTGGAKGGEVCDLNAFALEMAIDPDRCIYKLSKADAQSPEGPKREASGVSLRSTSNVGSPRAAVGRAWLDEACTRGLQHSLSVGSASAPAVDASMPGPVAT